MRQITWPRSALLALAGLAACTPQKAADFNAKFNAQVKRNLTLPINRPAPNRNVPSPPPTNRPAINPFANLFAPRRNLTPIITQAGERLDLPNDAANLSWHAVAGGQTPAPWAAFVPVGDTAAHWQNLITARVLPPGVTPSRAVRVRLATLAPACEKSTLVSFSPVQVDGGFDAFVSCTRPPPRAKSHFTLARYEALWLRGVFGAGGTNFLIERGWRGDTKEDSVLGSATVLAEWRNWFAGVGLAGRRHTRPFNPEKADRKCPARAMASLIEPCH